jgi:serine phosphatase RsbU (regulator of sigma subunit)/ligand-binding sensor domain-containing protein
MIKYLILLIGFVVTSVSVAWSVQPYTPVQPDPVLETWRWRSYPELKGLGLQCMTEDQDGNMWFGVNDGVRFYNGLTWTTYTSDHGLVDAPVVRLCSTRDGSVYAGTEAGISRFKDGAWTRVLPSEADQLWDVADLMAGSDGSLWAGTRWGVLHIKEEAWTFYTIELFQNWIRNALPQARLIVLPNEMVTTGNNSHPDGIGATIQKGYIWELFPKGPAETAGLKIGDRIISVNGNSEVIDINKPAGTVLDLTVERKGSPFEIVVTTEKIEGPWPHFRIHDVLEDQQGKMWFGLHQGEILYYDPTIAQNPNNRSEGTQFEKAWRLDTQDKGLDSGVMPRLAQTTDGDIWVGYFGSGKINRFDGQRWTPLQLRSMGGSDDGTALIATQDGALWIGGGGRALKSYRNGKWYFYDTSSLSLPTTRIFDMLISTDKALWLVYRGQEAVRFDYSEDRWSTFEGLHFQCETSDGMQWFLSKDDGIVRRDPSRQTWTRYDTEDGLMDKPNQLFMTRTGTLWAAGSHNDVATIALFTGQTWALQKHPQIGKDIDIRSGVFESENGTLWIAGRRSDDLQVGVLKLTGQTAEYISPPKVPTIIYGIGQSSDGTLWFGGESLSHYDGKTWASSSKSPELSNLQDWIDAIYTTSDRNLWLGTRSYGAIQYDGNTWTRYDTRQGLADSRIIDIFQTTDGSIWISTDNGISRFDGQTWLTQALHPDLAKEIQKKGVGQTQDGALWITRDGPPWKTTRLIPDSDPPETEITLFFDEVSQPGNTTLAWTGSDPWRVTPDKDVHFAYRLNGEAWSPFSTKKSHIFQTLSSGEHTFEVKARDQNFNEDPTPAVAHFTVIPPIWQQPWFLGLMVALLGSIGFQTMRVIQRDRRLQIANQKIIEEMEKELQAANNMQMSLLPESAPPVAGIDLSGICIPANHVGGDYYHYVFLDDSKTKLAVVLADVSGHAMEAATVALRFSDILRYEVQGRDEGTEILEGLDKSLKGQIQSNMFVTCGIGVLDLTRKSLTFASAGSPEVYHFHRETSEVETLGVTGIPLGMTLPDLGDLKAFDSTEKMLKSGDRVIFVSDGIEEACDHTEELYGQERLMSIIRKYSLESTSAEKLRDAILADVRQFLGDVSQEDDLTVVVLRVA